MPLLAAPAPPPLDRIVAVAPLLESMAAAARLRAQVADGAWEDPGALVAAFADGDALARLLLLPALAALPGDAGAPVLMAALEGPDPGEREHAAWALAGHPLRPEALPGLQRVRDAGGFGGMLAELTLEQWADPPGAAPPPARPDRSGRGLRIVQVFMQGWVDGDLGRAGAADGGGLATLLVQLSGALAARPEVDKVVTLTRAFAGDGVPAVHRAPVEPLGPRARIERIPFGGDGYLATADMWPHRGELERGLEDALRRHAPVDAVHLRFADAATFAAARVCRRLGIPVFFTLAPDPHALIHRRERAGTLDRDGLALADRTEHLLFRARLVERLRDEAAGLALLPRAGARAALEALVGLPADMAGTPVRTIPEGISVAAVDAAARRARTARTGVLESLAAAVRRLPAERHGLPLILSVGRLHRVKGFDRLVAAWAGAPDLLRSCNLVIVGGDLERPTPEERAVLAALERATARHPGARDGLVLFGHRPHEEVLELMAAARAGLPGTVAPGGVYACASEKEEFGLALLEGMASGLSVLGPALGGPPTFIDDGVTGTIDDTSDPERLRDGLRRAVAARRDERRAALAGAVVRERFTIEAMAAGLVALYAGEPA